MLEPIRQYAQDRLRESGAALTVQARHVQYFLRLAQQIEPRLLGSEQRHGLDELETEHANLLAALAWAAEHGPEAALKLSNALGWFWEKRGSLAEGREWFMRTIAQSPATLADIRGEAYVRAGRLACWQGDYDQAVALTEKGPRLCEQSGNRRWVGLALNNLRARAGALEGRGTGGFERCDYARARGFYEKGLQAENEMCQKSEVAITIGINLAELAAEEGKFDEARRLCISSLRNSQEVGDKES